ncbi:MAG: hypothetical protein FWC28_06440 [Proteobacteria bacterium]|nr:hypothetical protein [Cystobacterineae bacterium]MCL2259006.1 hypothetical protein [Cystobacterineae bacterium]MCL2314869.1 hypothetical protein [Pseudomonadota bacterium]
MSTHKVRVVFPKNIYGFLSLMERVLRKHREEGASSPLLLLPIESWGEIESKRERCWNAQQRAEALRREIEQLMEGKKRMMGELTEVMRAIRDVLLGIHAQSPRSLGEWGFEVNSSTGRVTKKNATTHDETE